MKVLVIEDDQDIGKLLSTTLTAYRYVVDWTANGMTGLKLATQRHYDLAILDLNLTQEDGVAICQQLRQHGHCAPILLLAPENTDLASMAALDIGANGYLAKPVNPSQLVTQIRLLLRQQGLVPQDALLAWGSLRLDPWLLQVTYNSVPVVLRPQEYSLLELFLRNPQHLFSRSSIIDYLWPIEDSPSDAAVTNLVKDLRQKLKTAGMTDDPIETVYRLGYRLRKAGASQTRQTGEQSSTQAEAVHLQLTQGSQQVNHLFKSSVPFSNGNHHQNEDNLLNDQQALSVLGDLSGQFQSFLQDQQQWIRQLLETAQHQLLSLEERDQLRNNAHRLAGTLGTFGYARGSEAAFAIEEFLEQHSIWSQEHQDHCVQQLMQLQQAIASVPDASFCPLPSSRQYLDTTIEALLISDHSALWVDWQKLAPTPNLKLNWVSEQAIALAQIQQHQPDVVLLDLSTSLETLTGIELLQHIKETYPHLPIVVIAEQDSLNERVTVGRLGGARYMLKPISSDDLFEAIAWASASSRMRARILVVDDDPLILQSLAELLTPKDFEVVTLSDPSQFWQVLKETHPNLLLLDLEMPNFGGVDLCRVVRQDAQYRDMLIFFVSAYYQLEHIQEAFAAGADDFIHKSLIGPELITRITTRLERSHQQQKVSDLQQTQSFTWRQEAHTDPLTRLANRRRFNDFLASAWQSHSAEQSPLSLILCDIDNFKDYNDHLGHLAGDYCLQQVASSLQSCIYPRCDLIARYGGEEFAVVLPHTDIQGALALVERIQEAIAQLKIPHPTASPNTYITLSLGVTVTVPSIEQLPSTLISTADQALYAAKARGRNSYCVYPM